MSLGLMEGGKCQERELLEGALHSGLDKYIRNLR
jgi:hypothetical protein